MLSLKERNNYMSNRPKPCHIVFKNNEIVKELGFINKGELLKREDILEYTYIGTVGYPGHVKVFCKKIELKEVFMNIKNKKSGFEQIESINERKMNNIISRVERGILRC